MATPPTPEQTPEQRAKALDDALWAIRDGRATYAQASATYGIPEGTLKARIKREREAGTAPQRRLEEAKKRRPTAPRMRDVSAGRRLADALEAHRDVLCEGDEEVTQELDKLIDRLRERPPTVTDDKLIELRVEGHTLRGIADIVGLSHCTVFHRLQKPHAVATLATMREKALARAGRIYEQHLADLAATEIAIGVGAIDGAGPQVSALSNALGRAGLVKVERVELAGSMDTAAAVVVQHLGAEKTVAFADEILRQRGTGEPGTTRATG